MTIYSGFSHWKWWCSIAMLNYQRVINLKSILQPSVHQDWKHQPHASRCKHFADCFEPSHVWTLAPSVMSKHGGIWREKNRGRNQITEQTEPWSRYRKKMDPDPGLSACVDTQWPGWFCLPSSNPTNGAAQYFVDSWFPVAKHWDTGRLLW